MSDALAHPLARLLDDELLALLGRRELSLRGTVLGQRQGPHRSVRAGVGRDFRDHRPYVPGDDLRRLDWRAAARQSRLMVRRTEAEEERSLALLVDASGGMAYGGDPGAGLGPGPTGTPAHKWRRAGTLACALAQVATRQGDPASLLLGVSGELRDSLAVPRAGRQRLRAIAEVLWDARAGGRCPWLPMFDRLERHLRPRSLVVAFSDLLDPVQAAGDDPDAAEAAIRARLVDLRARGHEVVLVQILHRDELDFPWTDRRVARFEDLRGVRAPVEAPAGDLRAGYLERIAAHLARQDGDFEREGIRLVRTVTDVPSTAATLELLGRIAGEPTSLPAEVASP